MIQPLDRARISYWVLVGSLVFFWSSFSHGNSFTIVNPSSDLATTGAEGTLRTSLLSLADSLSTEINTILVTQLAQRDMIRGFLDANATTAHGLGVDYASNPQRWIVGVQAGGGITRGGAGDINDSTSSGLPPVGLGVQGSLLYGTSLKGSKLFDWTHLPAEDLFLYFNFFALNLPHLGSKFSASFLNLGTHLQYQWVHSRSVGQVIKWGGVKTTAGLEFAHNTMKYRSQIAVSTTTNVSGSGTATLAYSGPFEYELDLSTLSLPLEVTTSVDLLMVMSLYAGVGADLAVGAGSSSGGLSGPLSAKVSSPPVGFSGTLYSATGKLDLSESSSPSLVNVRSLLGAQLNLFRVKALIQYSRCTNGTTSAAIGFRYAI